MRIPHAPGPPQKPRAPKPKLAPPKKPARDVRPISVVHATGPRELGLARKPYVVGGPGEPPPGFVTPSTSRTEWIVYWALARIFNDPKDPREPPFNGGEFWDYQKAALGSFTRQLGSAVIDFVIYLRERKVGLRVQTSRYHVNTTARNKGVDEIQRARLSKQFDVEDIYEQDFIYDRTGQAAIVGLKQVLAYGQSFGRPNPTSSGRGLRVRTPADLDRA